MKIAFALLLSCALTACATPATVLKNETTGQVARCGGDTTGSLTGGLIGYSAAKSDAEKCVSDHLALGFKIVGTH
jgi:hypothetical protein